MTEQLQTACPECSQTLRLPDADSIGKPIRCPKCQTKFVTEVEEQEHEPDQQSEVEVSSEDTANSDSIPLSTTIANNVQNTETLPSGPAPAGSSSSDRNLLLGVLAWQSGVISGPNLLESMKQWTFDKDKSLGEILIDQSAMANAQRDMLELLVDTHLRLRSGANVA